MGQSETRPTETRHKQPSKGRTAGGKGRHLETNRGLTGRTTPAAWIKTSWVQTMASPLVDYCPGTQGATGGR